MMTTDKKEKNKGLNSNQDNLDSADDEINILKYLFIIVQHKKIILGTMLVTFILACGITIVMPNIYTATARILPPQDNNGGLGNLLSGGIGDLAALAGVSVGNGSGELYVGMLESRAIADVVIDKFDLMKVYDQKYRVSTYKSLSDNVFISLGKKDGIIAISVEDEDARRAAEMANAYVEELKKVNIKLNLNSAGRERKFLEDRLAEVKIKLNESEDALRDFQEKNTAINIDEQATAIIRAIADLKAELTSNEVELGVILSYQTEQNPQVRSLRESIKQLKNQISKLEKSSSENQNTNDIFIATSIVPELGIKYARLLRDFKTQEKLFELLTKQYEVAKISEAKNTSSLQILDHAVAPDKKSSPKRGIIVIISTIFAGLLAITCVVIKESMDRMDDEELKYLKLIKSNLTSWKKTGDRHN